LGSPYGDIVTEVTRLAEAPSLKRRGVLVVDQTGVGRPVVEMLRGAPIPCLIVPVTITSGQAANVATDGRLNVPKAELVTCLVLAFQGHRLKLPRALPDTPVLVQELLNFQTKITAAGNETFESQRSRDHDDLVIALDGGLALATRPT
jgi:hypothetical protein